MANPIELIFKKPPPTSALGVELILGDSGGGGVQELDLEFELVVPWPVLEIQVGVKINVPRLTIKDTGIVYQKATPLSEEQRIPWQQAKVLTDTRDVVWEAGQALPIEKAVVWESARKIRPDPTSVVWELGKRLEPEKVEVPWQYGIPTNPRPTSVVYEYATRVERTTSDGWEGGIRVDQDTDVVWQQAKKLRGRTWDFWVTQGLKRARDWFIVWERARPVPIGTGPKPPEPPEPYVPSTDLDFLCRLLQPVAWNDVQLNFRKGIPWCPLPPVGPAVPALPWYFIVNSVNLTRVADGEPIEVFSANVGIDRGSWSWSFSAQIAYRDLEKVEPTISGPVEVDLEINGHHWRFLVEEYDTGESFPTKAAAIRGRSLSALLEDPYAFKRSFIQNTEMTTVQLAQAELDLPSSATGFSLDWQLVDELGWLVPANSWSYNDLTPIQAIKEIAESVGGYIQSHHLLKVLRVLPAYPVAPWNWSATPADLSIPKTLITRRNLSWTERPAYNGARVIGENTGVNALIRLTGTLGDFEAQAYIHQLITANEAATAKGIDILGQGGKQAEVNLDMPMHPDLGLLLPGMLIEVTNGGYGPEAPWKGLMRAVSIATTRAATGELTVNKTITLERHY